MMARACPSDQVERLAAQAQIQRERDSLCVNVMSSERLPICFKYDSYQNPLVVRQRFSKAWNDLFVALEVAKKQPSTAIDITSRVHAAIEAVKAIDTCNTQCTKENGNLTDRLRWVRQNNEELRKGVFFCCDASYFFDTSAGAELARECREVVLRGNVCLKRLERLVVFERALNTALNMVMKNFCHKKTSCELPVMSTCSFRRIIQDDI